MTRTGTRSLALLALCFLGFASLGLPDGALGVAWPRMRESFALPLGALGALLVATTGGYVTASFASGALIARTSVGVLLAASCALTGATLLGYAAAPSFAVLVVWGAAAGLGAGAIDAGINGFAATRYPPRTLHWLHAAYGLGTTAGPALMTHTLMTGASWRRGYLALGALQLALAACFAASLRWWPRAAKRETDAEPRAASLAETLRLPEAQLGALAFFLYLGVEASAGVWLYSLLEEGRGAPMSVASGAVTLYWGGLLAGRAAFGFAPNRWRPDAILAPAIAACALGAGVITLDLSSASSLAAAAALGFSAAPIFPALIGSTPERVGAAHAHNAIGLQVAAAALGQAGLPALLGLAAGRLGLELVPVAIAVLAAALLAVHTALARTRGGRRSEALRAL